MIKSSHLYKLLGNKVRLSKLNQLIHTYDINNASLSIIYFNDKEYKVTNIQKFKLFLTDIKSLHLYRDELNRLFNSSLYKTTNDELYIQKKEANEIQAIAKYLIDSFKALSKVLPQIVPTIHENALDIKLPVPQNFSELNTTLSLIDKILTQVLVNDKIKGKLDIKYWEYGSFWIELIVGTPAAISLVAGIAWSAAVISKKRVEVTMFEEQARTLKLKNDSLDDILNAQKEIIKNLIHDEAIGLLSKHFNNEDNEQRERIKYAIREFATLIQNGAEIHPSLETPENVKNLFPDFKQLESIQSKVTKQVEDKSE